MASADQHDVSVHAPAPGAADRPDTTDEPGLAGRRSEPAGAVRRALALDEVRWALVALALFAVAVPLQLAGAPAWTWLPPSLACGLAGGWGPAVSGLRALRAGSLDVDLLMIVAAIGAAAVGQVLDAALLIVIFATSGALEAWATARTEASVRGLLELSPERATRLEDTATDGVVESEVPVTDLVVGDVVLVRPGETVGADGTVLDGAGEVDQAGITGEPLPAVKRPGSEVFAGTVNGTGVLRVRVAREARDSVVARIAVLVRQASETKARAQRFVETVEQRYSVAVVVTTIAVVAVPLWWGEDLTGALLRAMTFMIVASPCAVVLSTMPPLLAAVATAGRRGVLVRSAQVMEDLGAVSAVALDKTGTLTRGRPELAGVHLIDPAWSVGSALATAAAAEHPSEHPVGRAVVAGARDRGIRVGDAADVTATPGRGVRAVVDGRTVTVSSPVAAPGDPHPAVRRVEDAGDTAVVLAVDEHPVAVLAVADALRPTAAATIAALHEHTGRTPVLLTGDNPRAAAGVAATVGIHDVRAGLLPEDKVAAIDDLRAAGLRVLVAGDGVNDAPALAAADVGVGMGGAGADLTLRAADVVVVRDELDALPALLGLARRARRIVIANLVVAAAIITGLVAWDLAGHLPLPLGVAGHEGSTVLVGLNGLRLLGSRSWRPLPRYQGTSPASS